MNKLRVKKLHENAIIPSVAKPGDLGYDIYAIEDVKLELGTPTVVRTGIAVQADKPGGFSGRNWEPLGLLIRDRSSMAAKGVITSGGVIDAGYRGEIKVIMTYTDSRTFLPKLLDFLTFPGWGRPVNPVYEIKSGDKIAQMIPIEVHTGGVYQVDGFEATERGADGFGSTGR